MYNISEKIVDKKTYTEMGDLLYPVAVFEDGVWVCNFAIDSCDS
jgi:hypothetical protein